MATTRRLLCALVSLALATGFCLAQATPNEIGVLGGAAYADKDLNDRDDAKIGPALGLRLAHFYNDTVGIFVDATYSQHDTELGALFDDDTKVWAVRLGPEFWFGPTSKRARWFVQPSIGYTALDYQPDDGSRFQASLGFGQRIAVGERNGFSWTLRADRAFGDDGVFERNVLNYQFLLGYAWGFGAPPADTDGDGVIDRRDKCPDTPRGAKVDLTGCPSDADGDGVFDGLDTCPDTPKGWPVDGKGCPLDSDADGVADGADKCPNTPRGAKVDAAGCPVDSDRDGVPDGLDRCPDTPAGTKVDANGCPVDSDGDGVLDNADKCPDTPRGTQVDPTGCPIPEKPAPLFTEEKKTLVLEGVNFETNKAVLLPEATAILDRVAESLAAWPEVRVQVGGHTDSRGSRAHNQKLSEARAQAVRQYLVDKGIDAARLTAKGFGLTKPIADNKTEEGRAQNRRVELTKLD